MTILQQLTQRLEKLESYQTKLGTGEIFVSEKAELIIDEESFIMDDCAHDVKQALIKIVEKRIYNVKQEISLILFPQRDEAEPSKGNEN